MIKRTIEISQQPAHLSVRNRQLLIKRNGQVVGQAPCEDLGVVLVDHPRCTYSHSALAALADSGTALVICGKNHLPAAVLLPLADHSEVIWRIQDQLAVGKPLRKQLWKQIVQAKIRAQAFNLPARAPARSKLLSLARMVRSGDPTNLEAQAARVYWINWLPDTSFRRDADGDGLNSLLNYGYAVLRAAVARALVGAGLMPSLGIHHRHRANSFCLADDLMEPLRPLVDDRARDLFWQGYDTLHTEAKAELLKLLAEPVVLAGESGPLMVALHRMAASLVRCYRREERRLQIPVAPAASQEGQETIIEDGPGEAAGSES